jgi:DNA-binding response OmpR family regulator
MPDNIPRPIRILVIDDDKTFSRGVEARLAKDGFRPELYFDGKAGIDAFKKTDFDLVVLDLVMPAMPGFTVLQELRKMNATVPIVVLSLLHQEEDVDRVMKLGATQYLSKSSASFMDDLITYAEKVSVS